MAMLCLLCSGDKTAAPTWPALPGLFHGGICCEYLTSLAGRFQDEHVTAP